MSESTPAVRTRFSKRPKPEERCHGRAERSTVEAVKRRKRNEVEETEEEIDKRNRRGKREHSLVEPDDQTKTYDKAEDNREQNIRRAPRDCDERLAPAFRSQVVRVIGHGLRPTEENRRVGEDEERGENERTHEIDVRERVKRESAGETRGRVAERVGGVAVCHLVCDDGENKDDEGERLPCLPVLYPMLPCGDYGTRLRDYW